MGAQHSHQGKWWAAALAFGVVGCNESNQIGPKNRLLQLLKEHLLAGFPEVQIEVQYDLHHALNFIAMDDFRQHISCEVMQIFLE